MQALVAAENYVGPAEKQRQIEALRDAPTPQDGASAAAEAKQCQRESAVLLSASKEDLQALVAVGDYLGAA